MKKLLIFAFFSLWCTVSYAVPKYGIEAYYNKACDHPQYKRHLTQTLFVTYLMKYDISYGKGQLMEMNGPKAVCVINVFRIDKETREIEQSRAKFIIHHFKHGTRT